MQPKTYLRLEGLTAFGAALAAFVTLDGPWWLLAVLALAPDLSMLGYLAGPRVGSGTYNLAHTYVLPLAMGGSALYADVPLAAQVAAVWVGHIGADRAVGYGLKYPTGFKDTHLSVQPAPLSVLSTEEEG